MTVRVCRIGCCPGCQDCYGMSIGCHQEPCRCDLPCSCDWAREDIDRTWRNGCTRHDPSSDRRREWARGWPSDDLDDGDLLAEPCPLCGADGACAYDDEGRPLIHSLQVEEEGP